MRIWSLHPSHLDPKGLVALWRETLLAQAVLWGDTRGYTQHPQLQRFKVHPFPREAIAAYLWAVHAQAVQRGYRFDASRIRQSTQPTELAPLKVTTGQIAYEWHHLGAKLALRDVEGHLRWQQHSVPQLHPLFVSLPGAVEPWEKI